MPKVTDAHRESRRDQIIDAALGCFAERGFQDTSMADIITASGLSAGAIYLYFAGKRDIVIAAARRTFESRASELAERSATGPVPTPAEVLRSISEGLDESPISPGLVVQLWGGAATDPAFHSIVTEAIANLAEQFTAYLSHWARQELGLDAAAARAWAEEVLPVMLACGQGLILQRTLLPDFDLERYLTGVSRVLG